MKKLTLLSLALLSAACSAPKYTYHFDHYDYTSEKKAVPLKQLTAADEKTLVASADEKMAYVIEEKKTSIVSKKEIADKIKAFSKEEHKELKKEIKKFVKENRKIEYETSPKTSNMAHDSKFAAISGGVGILLLVIGESAVVYILGAAFILVGFYFLIRWLSHP